MLYRPCPSLTHHSERMESRFKLYDLIKIHPPIHPSIHNAQKRPPRSHIISNDSFHSAVSLSSCGPTTTSTLTVVPHPRHTLALPRFQTPLALALLARLPTPASRARRPVLIEQPVFLDILHDGFWDEIPDRHVAAQEEADLGGGDVILDELLDHPDVVLPGLEGGEGLVDVGAGALGAISVRTREFCKAGDV